MNRFPATAYILQTALHNQSIIEQHLDSIANQLDDRLRPQLLVQLNRSCDLSNAIVLRLLMLLSDDASTVQCATNRTGSSTHRAIALRSLNQPSQFRDRFQAIVNDEDEHDEIRIIAFQAIVSSLSTEDIIRLVETVKSKSIRSYLRSLSKQSSIWLGQSGSYVFPFGTISVLFDEERPSWLPTMLQFEWGSGKTVDAYRSPKQDGILLICDRKTIVRLATMNDLFKWINLNRLFTVATLDGFTLQIDLEIDFNPFKTLFRR